MILRGDFQLSGRIGNTCLSVLSLIIVTPTLRKTERGKALYAKRKESIECVFGDAKEKHAMRLHITEAWLGSQTGSRLNLHA